MSSWLNYSKVCRHSTDRRVCCVAKTQRVANYDILTKMIASDQFKAVGSLKFLQFNASRGVRLVGSIHEISIHMRIPQRIPQLRGLMIWTDNTTLILGQLVSKCRRATHISHTTSLWYLGLLSTYGSAMLTEGILMERLCQGVSSLILGSNG